MSHHFIVVIFPNLYHTDQTDSHLLLEAFDAPHMCDFVALSSRNAFLRSKVGIFGIDKVSSGPTGDQTLFAGRSSLSVEFIPAQGQSDYPVLHRTSVKVVGDERVELWQRVLDVECFLVKRKGHSLDIERILRLADHVRGS